MSSMVNLLLSLSFWIIFAALIVSLIHLYKGPLLLDRVNALNLAGNILVGLFLVIAIIYLDPLYLEISLVLCLVGFIPIITMTHFLVRRYGK